MANFVYIATSLDGYIADEKGGLDWLYATPNPDESDFGWSAFMANMDALLMGRKTFEAVCGFDMPWPYEKPVFVLSHTMTEVPHALKEKVELVSGPLKQVVGALKERGFEHLYIDGGETIQGFLAEDLIDELTITRIPILLGAGVPLFGNLDQPMFFEHVHTEVHLNALVQSRYRRKK